MKTVAAVACACALLIVSVIPFADDTMPWYSIILQNIWEPLLLINTQA